MKKWSKPEISNLALSNTLARPEDKCTNNNGNAKNCTRNPKNEEKFEDNMFLCKYYVKNGHLCESPYPSAS